MLFKRYSPQRGEDLAGNKKQFSEIMNFLNTWKKGRALIISGPPGCGKTTAIRIIASDLGYEIVEAHNAGSLIASYQRSIVYKGKIILVEEGDIPPRHIRELIKNSAYPVFIIGDPYTKKLTNIRKLCKIIKFYKITVTQVHNFLRKICQAEKINYEPSALRQLADMSNGDLRSALIDLDDIKNRGSGVTIDSLQTLNYREKEDDIFKVLQVIFKANSMKNVRLGLSSSSKPHDELFMWIAENVSDEYDLEDMARAYHYLSLADIFRSRVIRRQSWGLQKYFSHMAFHGVAMSKKVSSRKFIMYRYPSYVRNSTDSVTKKLSARLGMSTRKSRDYIPLVKAIVKKDKNVAKDFGFTPDEIKTLIGF